MTFDIDEHAAAVTRLVRTASRRSLDWYRTALNVENKLAKGQRLGGAPSAGSDGYDPVTEADRAVEDDIRAALGTRFPDHAIFGEERGETGSGPIRWTIDPIDGTRAFVTGQPMWGTLVGLQVDGVPIAGWMHQPVLDETHVATPRQAALIYGDPDDARSEPLGVSSTTDLVTAVVLCTHPEMFAPGEQADRFARLAEAVRMVRYSGDCANYGLLASGLVDLVVENGLAPYDIIPLIPIVEAAGGVVTDPEGRSPVDGGYVVAAATPELHAVALEVLFGP